MTKQEEMNKRFDELNFDDCEDFSRCRHHRQIIKDFLQSEIDLAIAEERKRVVEMIENLDPEFTELHRNDILSLILKENITN